MKILTIAIFAMAYLTMPQMLKAQSPTLNAGLETLTMTKGKIDVEALTEIIMEKQKELKQEALRRFILKLFPETDYTTKFYVQNSLNLLLNEKNPQVIEKGIYELTTNYAFAMGVAKYFQSSYKSDGIHKFFEKAHLNTTAYIEKLKTGNDAPAYNPLIKEVENYANEIQDQVLKINRLKKKEMSANLNLDEKAAYLNKNADSLADAFKLLKKLESKRKGAIRDWRNSTLETGIKPAVKSKNDSLPFGIWLDIASKALSEIPELTKKGFFRKPIDFEKDEYYIQLSVGSTEDRQLFTAMANMSNNIKASILPYLKHYSVIENYYKTITNKAANKDIKSAVITSIKESFTVLIDENIGKIFTPDLREKFPAIRNFLTDFGKENNKINSIELLQQTLKVLPKANKDLIDLEIAYTKKLNELKDFIEKKTDTNMVKLDSTGILLLVDNTKILKFDTLSREFSTLNKSAEQAKYALETANNQFDGLLNRAKEGLAALGKSTPTDRQAWLNLKIDATEYPKFINIAKTNIQNLYTSFADSEDLYKALLMQISLALTGKELLPKDISLSEQNKEIVKEYAALIASTYKHVDKLIAAEKKIEVEDIQYIENRIIPEFIRLGAMMPLDRDAFNKQILIFNSLSKLLKIQAIAKIEEDFKYDDELKNVLKFVADFGKLDKAESYQDMLNLFEQTNNAVINNLSDNGFKRTYTLFSNAIKKYTLVNTQKQSVEIDVASFLNDLQQYHSKNNQSKLGLYLTLGLNQNVFGRKVQLPTDTINTIGFASEKIGLKYRLIKIKNRNGLENVVKSDVNLNTNAPFVNEFYCIFYGSGLLYSVANTSTTAKFDYPQVGVGIGMRFYNALDVNLTASLPFIPRQSIWKNALFGIGFDIPLGEYLEKIGSKKK